MQITPSNSVKPKGITYGSEVYGWDLTERAHSQTRGPVPPSDMALSRQHALLEVCLWDGRPPPQFLSLSPVAIIIIIRRIDSKLRLP